MTDLIKPDEIKKLRQMLLTASLAKLATLLGVTLSQERLELYLEPLSDLSEKQIERIFSSAEIKFKPFPGHTFPSPGELREYLSEHNIHSGLEDWTGKGSSEDKPPDWIPIQKGEAELLLKKIKEKAMDK